MNFPLVNIEQHLDERSLLKGEELLDEDQVQALQEIEKHLWIAQVQDDGKRYEVEAKISPSRLLACTCECERFRDIGICEHLAALLLLLRRRQAEKKRREKKQRIAKKTSKKLTTNAVLDSVELEDLVAFVRQYAKTNRSFALALKTRFAPQVSLEESKEKYVQLLDSAISLARKVNRNISQRGAQKIYKVLLELQRQIDDAILHKYYAEAFQIIQSIIEKITPILRKLENDRSPMEEQLDHSFQALQQLISRQPAPALRAEIWAYGLEEAAKLRYRNNGLDLRFFRILLSLADEKRKKEQLVGKLTEILYKYEYEGRNPAPILLLQLQLMEETGQKEEAERLMDRYLTDPLVLRYALRQAMQRNELTKVKMLARKGMESELPAGVLAEVEETLLAVAQREGNISAVIELATSRLTQTLDGQYVERLREAAREQWPQYRPRIIQALRQAPYSMERNQLISRVLADDEQWGELLQHLEQTHSIELLQQFDRLLLPAHQETVYRFYRKFLSDYIQHHLGPKPSARIGSTLQHLRQIQAHDLVREIVEELRHNYPERHTLMEELSLF